MVYETISFFFSDYSILSPFNMFVFVRKHMYECVYTCVGERTHACI